MKDLITRLDGNKTHIGVIAGGVLGILFSLGVVDEQTAGVIASIVAAWTGVAIRDAWRKNDIALKLRVEATERRSDEAVGGVDLASGPSRSVTQYHDRAGNVIGTRTEAPTNPQ